MRLFNYMLSCIKDPFRFDKHIKDISNSVKTIEAQVHDVTKSLNELKTSQSAEEVIAEYEAELEKARLKAEFYASSLEHIGDIIPDMIWMKDLTGAYQYANKAIKDGLLFDDAPIGKTDATLGYNAVNKFGEEYHDFGAYCSGSDAIVIDHGHRKRFIEYGMSGGRPLVLEVFKNVVRDKESQDVIATVGCGRDITDMIFTLLGTYTCPDCGLVQRASDLAIEKYLDEHLYENASTDDTLISFYKKNKDTYGQ